MGILVDKNTRLVVQGITGREGSFHTKQMIDFGTEVVAGVTPGKGGTEVHGIPVFDSVHDAVGETDANTSVVFVPAGPAPDAVLEAADAGIGLIVVITEGIPVHDAVRIYRYLQGSGSRLIGPNCPGVTTAGESKAGIMPNQINSTGSIGVVSRSGTLTYEVVDTLTKEGIGQSTCVGIGGDPVIGTPFIDVLELFENDRKTAGVVLIGEIGGDAEEKAVEYIKKEMTKPVIGMIVGITAPPDKTMGHAGAIVSGGAGSALDKIRAFKEKGIPVAGSPGEVVRFVREML